ncbi:MAG: hypothetical protein K2I79_00575 [Clostridia bacterium]|nr:hypothetical protein [Clostridia bacterium]
MLLGLLYRHKVSSLRTQDDMLAAYKKEFEEAIDDDLNIPLALGVLWKMVKEERSADIYKLALDFDRVLGLSLENAKDSEAKEEEAVPADIVELCEKRRAAKAAKDYAGADALRAEITAKGYIVTDTKEGYKVVKA